MTTREPPIDLFNPVLQELRDGFEAAYLPQGESVGQVEGGLDGGLEAVRFETAREYFAEAKRPYVRALIEEVLKGHWGHGDTQESVASGLLTKDRAWISEAKTKGELSFEMFARIRLSPTCPAKWEPNMRRLNAEMCRCGFLGVARHLARAVTGRPKLIPDAMGALEYEIMCEVFGDFAAWSIQRIRGGEAGSSAVLRRVADNRAWESTGVSSLKRDREEAESLLPRLFDNPSLAHEYVCDLVDCWLDVFVAAHAAAETLYGAQE